MFTGVGIFALLRVRTFVCDDQEAFGNGYKGAQSASEMTLVLGSTSIVLVQGLAPVAWGQDVTRTTSRVEIKMYLLFGITKAVVSQIFTDEEVQLMCVCALSCVSRVQLYATLWTVAHQAPLSRGFSR